MGRLCQMVAPAGGGGTAEVECSICIAPLVRQARDRRAPGASGFNPASGFTLVELMIVVVILAILAGLSAGAVVRYSNKARVSAAKALVASAARECLRWMVDSQGQPLVLGTTAGEGFRLIHNPPCGSPNGSLFNVTIDAMPTSTYGVNVNPDGSLTRVCTGSVDCVNNSW